MKTIVSFFMLFFTSIVIASPAMTICLKDCSNKVQVKLSDKSIKQLQTLFLNKDMDAKKERQCIANAIALMEKDIYRRISQKIPGNDVIDKMQNQLNKHDKTTNTRQFLRYLLDQHYIRQHILRRTQKRTSWLGSSESTSVIQSIAPYASYAVDSNNTEPTEGPVIIDINIWRKEKTLEGIQFKLKKIVAKPATHKPQENVEYDFK